MISTNQTRLFIHIAVVLAVTLSTYVAIQFSMAKGRDMERIILIPEPSITDIRREDWAIDRPAMLEHYNKVFAGMSAEQVIELLETEEAPFKFVSDSEIQFAAEKSFFPPLASYGCLVRIAFIDGMFNEAVDVSMCGVTV